MQVQFKPGDKVRRTAYSDEEVQEGGVYTVKKQVDEDLYLHETQLSYKAAYFVLVGPIQALEEQIKVAEETLAELKKQKETLEKAKTYSTGQRFNGPFSSTYLLAQVGAGLVCLISEKDGNYWTDSQEVRHPKKITQAEFDKIQSTGTFTPIN